MPPDNNAKRLVGLIGTIYWCSGARARVGDLFAAVNWWLLLGVRLCGARATAPNALELVELAKLYSQLD